LLDQVLAKLRQEVKDECLKLHSVAANFNFGAELGSIVDTLQMKLRNESDLQERASLLNRIANLEALIKNVQHHTA
jgi:hypothetical protein